MKVKTKDVRLLIENSKYYIVIAAPINLLDKIKKLIGLDLNIEIKRYRQDRSLTANRYLWQLTNQLAEKLTIPRGDMYIKLIKGYGKVHQFRIKDEALTELIRTWNIQNTSVEHTESLCDVTHSFRSQGILWHELNCYAGSSGYNSKEFSVLVNGIVSECITMGIETIPPEELNRLVKEIDND